MQRIGEQLKAQLVLKWNSAGVTKGGGWQAYEKGKRIAKETIPNNWPIYQAAIRLLAKRLGL